MTLYEKSYRLSWLALNEALVGDMRRAAARLERAYRRQRLELLKQPIEKAPRATEGKCKTDTKAGGASTAQNVARPGNECKFSPDDFERMVREVAARLRPDYLKGGAR